MENPMFNYTDYTSSDDEFDDDQFSFEGDCEIHEYDPSYSPFANTKPTKYYSFPKPIINIEKNLTLETMFSKPVLLKSVEHVKSRKILKLCKYLMNNQRCPQYNMCKYAHEYYMITRCKFDNCKKTKLVGPGTFINIHEKPCKLRHHLEDVNSFIVRTQQYTSHKVTLCIFQDCLSDLESILQHIIKSNILYVQLKIV